jgi:1-acyl-sn-glycerol-3-phosphate acyltransferase
MMRRSRDDIPEHRPFSHLMQGLNRLYGRSYHRLVVRSPCPLPRRGAAILVCNHTSGLDPQLIQSTCPRLITWMMAREYYEIRLIRAMLDRLGTIPVQRSGRDMSAMRSAIRALENGQVLGIFPEGRIEEDRVLLPFQTGVALLAIKTGAPVYCACIDGSQRRKGMLAALCHSQHATLAFRPAPVAFDRSDDSRPGLERATEIIRLALRELQHLQDLD